MKEIFDTVYINDENNDDLYIQGLGFLPKKTKEISKAKIKKTSNVFAILIIAYFALKRILFYPIAMLFTSMGFELYTGHATSDLVESTITSITDFIAFSSILIASYSMEYKNYKYIHFFKKIDMQVSTTSIMISLSFWTIGNFVAVILEDLFKIFGIINTPAFQSISLLDSFIQDNVLMLIVISILQEIFFRGIVLFKLREFGDTFAIIVTSILFCSVSTEFLVGVKWFFLSLPLCYFTLKSNNVSISIISRLVCSISLQVVRIIFSVVYSNIAYLILICIGVAALLFGLFFYFELDFKIDDKDTHYTNFEKVYISITSFTFLALIFISIFKAQTALQFIG